MYSDSQNIWITKTEQLEPTEHSHDFTLNSFTGISAGGLTDGMTGSKNITVQYILGETNFYGFSITDFDGAKICR